jgi:putative tryptophan/tyrosine transport system substrate-binding protein
MDKTEDIVSAANQTPVVAYSKNPVIKRALCGFVADDEKLGYLLAKSLVEVLVEGKAIDSVPVKVDGEPKFFLNAKTAEKLGIEVPFSILDAATIIE